MPEQQPENIIDQFFTFLQQLLLPNWSDLILLLPWVLMGLVLLWLLFTAFQWRGASKINRSRVPPRLAGGAPPAGSPPAGAVSMAVRRADRRRFHPVRTRPATARR